MNAITNISERYKNAGTVDKRAIVGLVYREKLILTERIFQTTEINSLAENIFLIKKEIGRQENRLQMSVFVNVTGLYSNHLLAGIDHVLKVLNDV